MSEHCERDFDTLIGNISPNSLEVEPIYPDLITPPGGSISVADGESISSVQSQSNTFQQPRAFLKCLALAE